jgi:alpha-tubulin suppressor-like RCC1 family protein
MNLFKKLFVSSLGFGLLGSTLLATAPVSVLADDFGGVNTHNETFVEVETTLNSTIFLTTDRKTLLGTGSALSNGVRALNVYSPEKINIPLAENEIIIDIDGSYTNFMVATSLGNVYVFGQNLVFSANSATPVNITNQVNPSGLGIKGVRAGYQTNFIWFENDTIVSWGSNNTGQLGTGTAMNSTLVTVPTTLSTSFKGGNTIVDFDIMFNSAWVLLSNGDVWVWGRNAEGQLGLGDTTNRNSPQKLSLSNVYSISIGLDHGLALTGTFSNFQVYAWGRNVERQLTAALDAVTYSSPQNITNYLTATDITIAETGGNTFNYSLLGDSGDGQIDSNFTYPLSVYASFRISFMVITRYYDGTFGGWHELYGFGDNSSKQISVSSITTFSYPRYVNRDNFYDNDNEIYGFSNHGGFSAIVNQDGDYLLYGTNSFGRLGSEDENETFVTNYSYDVRYLELYTLPYIPENLTAPIDWTALNQWWNTTYGPTYYNYQDHMRDAAYAYYNLTEKEFASLSDESLTILRSLLAVLYEDDLYYFDSYFQDDLDGFSDDDYTDVYYDYRGWMEELVAYFNYYAEETIDEETIAYIATPASNLRTYYADILTSLESLEALLVTFDGLIDIYGNDYETTDLYDFLEELNIIFTAYETLGEDLVQLLVPELHEYYFDLYYDYYYSYINEYQKLLYEIEDLQWEEGTYALFAILDQIKDVLAQLENMPDVSKEWFTYFNEYWEEYDYWTYSYWIYLSDLVPILEEGFPVYEQLEAIDLLELEPMTKETADAILAMFTDYLALSEDAQDLFDIENIFDLFYAAFSFYTDPIYDMFYDIEDTEYDAGYYGLFAIYDLIEQALATFDNLPVGVLLDELTGGDDEDGYWYWLYEYYLYLSDLKPLLEEGLDVYNQIMEIEEFDFDNLTTDDVLAISNMYTDYLALSEEVKELLDPEYVAYLASIAVLNVQNNLENLPEDLETFETLFADPETKDEAIEDLLNAWNYYQSLSDELKAQLDPDYVANLQAMYARYLQLIQPTSVVNFAMLSILIVHLVSGTYFAFKKRDLLTEVK